MLFRQIPNAFQEAWLREYHPHVARDGFDDDAGDVVTMPFDRFREGIYIIIGKGQG